jgi:hypothetical protein
MIENNNTNFSSISAKECLDLYDTICKNENDPLFLISLAVNFLLLMTTGISELMASSKCKFNSLFELLIYPFRKLLKKKNNHQEEDRDLEAGTAEE